MARQLKLTLVRSLNGRLAAHKACVRGLGIRRLYSSVVVVDSPENRGMVNRVRYMLKVEDV